MKHRFIATIIAVVSAARLAANAEADPLMITQGAFIIDMEPPAHLAYAIAGDTFQIGLFSGQTIRESIAVLLPTGFQQPCTPNCVPGERLRFSNRTDGMVSLGHGPVNIDGQTYPDVQLSGALMFLSPGAIVPPFAPGGDRTYPRLEAPFRFSGRIVGLFEGEQLFAHRFRGRGTADMFLFSFAERGYYIPDEQPHLDYRFSSDAPGGDPVPEPATLLFVGTGLVAGIGVRARLRRSR